MNNGYVELQPGQYNYEIYDSRTDNTLDITDKPLVEEGLSIVYPADDNVRFKYYKEYKSSNETNSNYIFGL